MTTTTPSPDVRATAGAGSLTRAAGIAALVEDATFVIGIAGADGGHMGLLSKIAKIFSKKESVAQLEAAQTPEEILDIFGKVNS